MNCLPVFFWLYLLNHPDIFVQHVQLLKPSISHYMLLMSNCSNTGLILKFGEDVVKIVYYY
jgi:hypothetical protein